MSPPHRILAVVGTRPDALKLAPLVHELRARRPRFDVHLCSTGQHAELLRSALATFDLHPDTELGLMSERQSVSALLARCLTALEPVVARVRPDLVVVQGDTTSTLAGALAAQYAGVPVAHVEAGLRSGDLRSPFPEEQHRRLVARIAHWHFAPTEVARQNLLQEGCAPDRVFVTGNTGVDALRWIERRSREPRHEQALDERLRGAGIELSGSRRLVVATVHRREQIGAPLVEICAALAELASASDVAVVMPVHPNPEVREIVERELARSRVHRVRPFDPVEFVGLLRRAKLVITDSGGVQEEATTLGIPAVIVRTRCDRPEAVQVGASRLVGHERGAVIAAARQVLGARATPETTPRTDVFGDGRAAQRIVDLLSLAELAAHG